jgi:FAD-dependent urate hydroxylase
MQIEPTTDLLIIGAGPFGLAMAAYAEHLSIDTLLVGKSMEFWQKNMPSGMFLRSACDWHLDPTGIATIEAYLQTQGLTPADVEPLSLDFYLGYARWFQAQKQIMPLPLYVQSLTQSSSAAPGFVATLENGETITARNVVVAPGFKYFRHIPAELADLLPADRFHHTCDLVDFSALQGKRCLVLGGRQSAFEWTALLREAGAAAIHVSHRHPSPAFAASDWSWVNPLVDAMVDNPGWFRNLTEAEKEQVSHRLWAEGRLKVEPWLAARVLQEEVTLWPKTCIVSCRESESGELVVVFDTGAEVRVDHIILATGYKVNLAQLPFLANGDLLARLEIRNGFPVLDEHFQTNLPGLYVTSMPAAQDFGPFFGFTISVRTSARLIGDDIRQRQHAAEL